MKIEIDINERTIIEGVIDEVNTGWVQKAVDNHLAETNFAEHLECDLESEVDPIIENFMSNMDLSDYIDVIDYIDADDIRYNIEDDILEQVNDHLDYDTIRYNIEDDIADSCWSNFDIDDHIDYDIIKEGLEYDELEDRVESLETQLEALEACFESPRKVGLIRRFLGWLW
tara:strand:+ start:762 stop:1274 length:513 start_codon:yes stop_codon:yes gene_type:complete